MVWPRGNLGEGLRSVQIAKRGAPIVLVGTLAGDLVGERLGTHLLSGESVAEAKLTQSGHNIFTQSALEKVAQLDATITLSNFVECR